MGGRRARFDFERLDVFRAKVASLEGQKIYRRRKCIPEPVFGQIKQAMGFRGAR
jgi:hypothetical protein